MRLSGVVCRPVASAYHVRLLRVSAFYVPFIYVDRICSRSASNELPHFIPPSGGAAAVSGIFPLASPHKTTSGERTQRGFLGLHQ